MRFLNNILYLLLISVAFVACTDDIHNNQKFSYEFQVSATLNEIPSSRAEFDATDLTKVAWQSGDEIEVFVTDVNGVVATGTLVTKQSGESAYFTGPVTASEGLTPPFSISATYGAEQLNISEGTAQYQLGALKPLMEAHSSEPIYYVNRTALNFSQVAAAINIKDIPAKVSKLYIESLGNDIVGTYTYSFVQGTGSANAKTAEVDVKSGSAQIGVAPGQYTEGFKLKFIDADGNFQYVKLPGMTIEKGHSYNISVIDNYAPISFTINNPEAYHIDANGSRSTGGANSDVAQSGISWGNVQFSGAPLSMIEEIGVKVYDSSNNVVYTSSSNEINAKEIAGDSHIWGSYKKHGTQYTLKAYATIEGETYESEAVVVTYTRPTIYVSKPTESHTSYSKYIAGDVSGANNCNGSSIYLTGTTTFKGVTTEVFKLMSGSGALALNGTQYEGTISGQSFSNSKTLSNQDWKAHELKAMVSFDGMDYYSDAQTMYVTGLPYNEIPIAAGSHPWKAGNSYATFPNGLQLGLEVGGWQTGKPYAYSCAFYIPADISVNVSATYDKAASVNISSHTLKVAQSDLSSTGSNYISVSNKKVTNVTSTGSGTMTSKYNAFYFENSATVVGYQYTIKKFAVSYR